MKDYGHARWCFGWFAGIAYGVSVSLLIAGDQAGLWTLCLAMILFFADVFYTVNHRRQTAEPTK